ncbi:MAG: glycosyltransferase family 2 protein [Candidatus Omnitrophica bacterium]|nr:glycosyltransferase family 2 protein [Candidatus Omnitrophota bacterium]
MSKNNIFFSIIIPSHNEGGCIATTCKAIISRFALENITDYEILVVNDNSNDHTERILKELCVKYPVMRYVNNTAPRGFGFAVRKGLEEFYGDTIVVVMADLSDSPDDILAYYRELKKGAECVFGSRFIKGAHIHGYPVHKYVLNRMANFFIKLLFTLDHNDITNAFKAYRREVIDGMQPLLSYHFNLTVEMPLKAIVRGYNYVTIPISWTNRSVGVSKLKIKEMGSRYLFIVLYVWLEKSLSRGDYMRKTRSMKKTNPDVCPPSGRPTCR